ncbi:TlpA family protein disulfide reductase [Oceanobacillus damuensis]|uniref:TlpA family protein disulfide reductase n=1 Tax=Oceanobacillus damuensis TaxID=937928 RepID=UPI00082CD75A|nr:TlpA disulfide reductase family protein [Oceanobacillus damuensis]
MFKKMFGVTLLIVLAGIIIGNFIEQQIEKNAEPNIYNVTGDPNAEGGAIAPPESTGIEPGEAAPDFELETLDGGQLKLSDLQGKKVIINFWYTWCPPCREEMPEMQKFYEEYGDEVEIVAVNLTDMEKNEQDVHDFIEEFSFTYTIPLDHGSHVSDQYKVYAAPTSYFIGTDGTVQQPRWIGPMEYEFMEEMVHELN